MSGIDALKEIPPAKIEYHRKVFLMRLERDQSLAGGVADRWGLPVSANRGSVMGIATTLAQYLSQRGAEYDVVEHPHTATALDSARTSHIALSRLAKAVVLKGGGGFILAVLPASSHIQFSRLHQQLGDDLDMASEEQIETLFPDCEPGAVPAIGAAYGLRVLVDDSLANEPEIYFEGGDHASLVHISGSTFRELLADAGHGRFTESG